MSEVFRIRESLDAQHWTSGDKRYNIQRLYDFAEASTDPEDVPIDSLMYGFRHTDVDEEKWSPEFVRRCQEADLSYPILVVQDAKKRFWVADGNHRVGKAIMQGLEMVPAYVVRERDLPEKALEQKESYED